MPPNKKQHYVPRFFFRGWTDSERVPHYNIDNREEYPPTKTDNLCKDDYFYDKNTDVEQSLGELESIYSDIFKKVINKRSLSAVSLQEGEFLLSFILLQRWRTRSMRADLGQVADVTAKDFLGEEYSGSDIIDQRKAHQLTLLRALVGTPILSDMEGIIIENGSDTPFIFSDNPVVFDSESYREDLLIIGASNRGLQIFCPLSDELQLIMFDPSCYRVPQEEWSNHGVVSIESDRIARSLNDLQLISAYESVFYSNPGRDKELTVSCERLSDHLKSRSVPASDIGSLSTNRDDDMHMEQYITDYSPYLPFVRRQINVKFRTQRNLTNIYNYKRMMAGLSEMHDENVSSALIWTIDSLSSNLPADP